MMSHDSLIKNLIESGYLKTSIITKAFRSIDRKDFVPDEVKDSVYLDSALPIGYGQTISQPLTVAFMLELLQPEPGEKILDIGAGSGWKAALLAHIVSQKASLKSEVQSEKSGKVISIERIPELKEMAEQNIAKYNFIVKGIAEILLGDGSKGAPAEKVPPRGFDKIIAGAAGDEIPQAWKDQLKIGGKIIAPVKNSILVLEKVSKDVFEKKEYYGFSFVPLISG